ncbi:GTPase-activating protein, putative [Plasmodium knowlesi strain H]|uniref:GTPase-activating protein, putative n=3 Tax=Plasmodium knowlesi TaxID=5850 RepID=A0A1A7VCZ0_PLAKH|nr:GTPase-activating protein, putative [Plasmodium knowlesi strain H]OTN67688.1 putative GTPase-activating protein [Plasmodium knowlesi]CAA9990556.1 GTPase-activating protein, putative [Plasmodium knowlesi strain H]SBO19815.1 GTPase-activating protein, putative [Plasmodium knowlesi strain H]SBO22366.1 GTPase-activating protein, putative [Plasmodium knowlesi strain H]VVS80030.1 GTPase-activating protein, putative [Plasmodium knowlesi strain H]
MNDQYADTERSGRAPPETVPAETMHLKKGGGRKKKDDNATGGVAAKEGPARNQGSTNDASTDKGEMNEAAKSKLGASPRKQSNEMVRNNDDPDSCSVYDDMVEKNKNFSESIIANLNDNIFEQNDAFTNEKGKGKHSMVQEEMANGKQLDAHTGVGRSSGSASSSSSLHMQDGRVSMLSKDEIAEEEGIITQQMEQSRRNNSTTEGNEKEKFVFPSKVKKTSWSKEKAPENVYDEYNHNVIYHELYVELLQVNKNLQNEIKNLRKIIDMQKHLIKSREDLFDSGHMNEKNKNSSKKFVNNNYFLNFFNKKKKKSKEGFAHVPTGSGVERASARISAYGSIRNNEEVDEKDDGYWSKGEKNRLSRWKRMDNNSDDLGYSSVEMNTMDNREDVHDHKNEYVQLPVSENEGSVLSDNPSGGASCYDNHSDNNSRTPVCATNEGSQFFKGGNYQGLEGQNHTEKQKSYEHGYEGVRKVDREGEVNEMPVNLEEITTVTLWYEEILPLVNNEKKRKTLIDLMITNYMPIVIKTYFWEINIINKLNITDYFVQILIKNTNFIQSYVYTNNKQYHNHVSRYFKSLITFRNSNVGGVQSDGGAMVDDASGKEATSGVTEKREDNTKENIDMGEKPHGAEAKEGESVQRKEEDNCIAGLNLLQRFSFQKFFYQILIDLDRTLYIIKKNQEYFRKHRVCTDSFLLTLDLGETKAKLNTLLQMYVVFKPELGYVQGMSYIALVFLLYCNLEKAFVHFANFMERKEIYNLYSFNNNEIKIYTYIIKEILNKQNVEIYKEICKQYNIDNIFIQWIYTIFLTCLPFHIFIRLFDIYLFNEKIIYETILCIFSYFNKFHHVENVDVVVKNLSTFSFNTHIQEDKFWSLLKKSKIKKRKIVYYREKYFKAHREVLNEK